MTILYELKVETKLYSKYKYRGSCFSTHTIISHFQLIKQITCGKPHYISNQA